MRLHRPSHATVVAYLALFVAMSGTAVAATGNVFILGQDNRAGHASVLANRSGTPLELRAKSGNPQFVPLLVDQLSRSSPTDDTGFSFRRLDLVFEPVDSR